MSLFVASLASHLLLGSVVEAKLLRHWYEHSAEQAGRRFGPNDWDGQGWRLDRKEALEWSLSGELQGTRYWEGIFVSTTSRPWRLDLKLQEAGGHSRTLLGIFRFDGDDLIWVSNGTKPMWYVVPPLADHPARPSEFVSTKENGYRVTRLKPAQHDWQRVFPAPNPAAPVKK